MKLITYLKEGHDHLAMVINDMLYDMDAIHPELPASMAMFLNYWDDYFPIAQNAEQRIKAGLKANVFGSGLNDNIILPPVPYPTSCRNANAFGQHIAAAMLSQPLKVMTEFYQFPIFNFTNHNSIIGPGAIACMPDHFKKLDYELQVAIVICKPGKNILAVEADEYIGGLMILNDISARTLQMEELFLNQGTAKGKDFATVTGPMLVTLDELQTQEVACHENHTGKSWSLDMNCKVNGIEVSKGNVSDMIWTFAEIIERCSYGVQLFAGDVIGSGAVNAGSFLALNGTGKLNNPVFKEQWLQEGDVIEMEIKGLGKLINTIQKEESDFSILDLKK